MIAYSENRVQGPQPHGNLATVITCFDHIASHPVALCKINVARCREGISDRSCSSKGSTVM